MLVYLAYQLHFLFCILQVTTNLQSSVYSREYGTLKQVVFSNYVGFTVQLAD